MRCFLLVFIAFVSTTIFAQQADTIQWSNDAITRAEWPKPLENTRSEQFIAYLDVKLKKERINKTTHVHYWVDALWLRSESFLADSVTSRFTPLAQLFFDCYELESRKLQDRLNDTDAFPDIEIPESNKRVNDQISSLRTITKNGFDTTEIQFWRQWMDSALLATPRFFLPNFESGNGELGFDLGGGVSSINGHLSNYFQILPAFGYGLSFGSKRFQFNYHALHSYAQSDSTFIIGDFKFADSNRLQINQSSWTFGYQCFNRYKWTITPYAGLSTFRIINRDEPKGSLYAKGRASFNWEIGAIAEWRFLQFYQSNSVQLFWKLRLKVGYAPIYYLHVVRGNALKIQLGIGFTMKSIRNLSSQY